MPNPPLKSLHQNDKYRARNTRSLWESRKGEVESAFPLEWLADPDESSKEETEDDAVASTGSGDPRSSGDNLASFAGLLLAIYFLGIYLL